MYRKPTFSAISVMLVCSLLINTSCASIFSGTTQTVNLKTYPKGAQILVNGKDVSQSTPSKIRIRRAVPWSSEYNNLNEQVYTFKKEGYEDLVIRDKRRINSLALMGDMFLFFLIFPLLVDFASGSIYKYRKNIRVDMKPIKPVIKPAETVVAETKQNEQPVIIKKPESTFPSIAEMGVASPIPEAKQVNPDAVAVVIGNKRYSGKQIPDVDFAQNDAAIMKKYLQRTFGYREGNIIYLEDATLGDFQRVFGNANNHRARLHNLIKPNESDVFVYYSGHGAPSLSSKQGYLVPSDCEDISLIEFEGFPLNTLFYNIGQLPYKSMTIVLDACFSGVTEKGNLIKQASPVYIKNIDQLLYDERTSIFSSCQSDQVSSWYTQQQHSLFTFYFLKGIQGDANKDRDSNVLNFSELRNYLIETVPYQARRLHNRTQIPEINGQLDKPLVQYK